MEQGGHPYAVLLKPLAVLPGDLEVRLDKTAGGDSAQADDDFGADQRHLAAQIVDAGVLLGVQRVPVLGRTALDHVGDVDILLTAQVHHLQHVVQQLAAPAHKGLALQVLVFAGALAYAHDLRVPGAGPEYHVVPGVRQGALLAGQTGLFQFLPICDEHTMSSLVSKFDCLVPLSIPQYRSAAKGFFDLRKVKKNIPNFFLHFIL